MAELGPGEVGYLIAGIKDVGDARSGETITTASKGSTQALPGLPGPEADGVLRSLPDRRRRLREPPRVARQAQAQRFFDQLHARVVGSARLRVPMRVPRAAAHGDRQGAARARVRSRPDRHRALGRVPRHADRRHHDGRVQSERAAARAEDRLHRGTGVPRVDHHAQGVHGQPDGAVPEPARRHEEDGVPVARARRVALRDPARRGGRRFLRPAQVAQPGVCLARLRARRLSSAPTSCASTSC